MRRLLVDGAREDRALIYLMVGCLMVFVAQTPRLAREAFETGQELSMLLGATLMAWMFIMPLVLYALGAGTYLIAKLFGSRITSYAARVALFWALLASSPLILLWGLTAGFVGPGIEMNGVGLIWFAVFMWFWIAGFRAAAQDSVDQTALNQTGSA
ncbi:hypothetical protein Z946_3962 [Sulfitobacter noctilucicola]|nr:hypothetical protein Z946_3962 [Sulfitobacter noctilucicola]